MRSIRIPLSGRSTSLGFLGAGVAAVLVATLVLTALALRPDPPSAGPAPAVVVPGHVLTPRSGPTPQAAARALPVQAPVDPAVVGARHLLSERWVTRMATRAGVPAPAIRAYAAATLVVAHEQPRCHLGWTTLAGIGWVESQHGTLGGRTLGPDGRSDRPVLGPALNGLGGTAAVRGPASWDRAVGPMQFISSTWRQWAADGNADGVADPFQIDDAALAAARYLCDGGRDLAAGGNWGTSVFSYNHSQDYVVAVYAAASTYADRTRS